jgi:hypothetical protein
VQQELWRACREVSCLVSLLLCRPIPFGAFAVSCLHGCVWWAAAAPVSQDIHRQDSLVRSSRCYSREDTPYLHRLHTVASMFSLRVWCMCCVCGACVVCVARVLCAVCRVVSLPEVSYRPMDLPLVNDAAVLREFTVIRTCPATVAPRETVVQDGVLTEIVSETETTREVVTVVRSKSLWWEWRHTKEPPPQCSRATDSAVALPGSSSGSKTSLARVLTRSGSQLPSLYVCDTSAASVSVCLGSPCFMVFCWTSGVWP